MDETTHNQIADLLGEQMGFDARSTGPAAISRAVQQRMAALGMQDPEEYWRQASTQSNELQELIEAVVVPETWFFRYPDSLIIQSFSFASPGLVVPIVRTPMSVNPRTPLCVICGHGLCAYSSLHGINFDTGAKWCLRS